MTPEDRSIVKNTIHESMADSVATSVKRVWAELDRASLTVEDEDAAEQEEQKSLASEKADKLVGHVLTCLEDKGDVVVDPRLGSVTEELRVAFHGMMKLYETQGSHKFNLTKYQEATIPHNKLLHTLSDVDRKLRNLHVLLAGILTGWKRISEAAEDSGSLWSGSTEKGTKKHMEGARISPALIRYWQAVVATQFQHWAGHTGFNFQTFFKLIQDDADLDPPKLDAHEDDRKWYQWLGTVDHEHRIKSGQHFKSSQWPRRVSWEIPVDVLEAVNEKMLDRTHRLIVRDVNTGQLKAVPASGVADGSKDSTKGPLFTTRQRSY